MNHRHIFAFAIAILITAAALPQCAFAKPPGPADPEPAGQITLANTSEIVAGDTHQTYGTRIPFTVGFDQGGYDLTGFSILFGDNTAADFTNVTITLYSANSPENDDFEVSTFNIPTPGTAGLYTYNWPTNVFLPGQISLYAPTYYNLFVAPTYQLGSTQSLVLDYTTSTNYTDTAGWDFYPDNASINGNPNLIPIFNLYATVLPPPQVYPIKLTNEIVLSDQSFQFGFTNSPNATLAFTNWLVAGNPDYLGTNYYQYNSGPGLVTNATYPRLYFRVTSP
jgi:hypothetical protein